MADMRLVHNTRPYILVVSSTGRRLPGGTSAEIDISEPRAQKYLASGVLVLVQPVADEPVQTPAADDSADTTDPTNTEGV